MTEFAESIEIERDADAVWEVVGDVARISDWLPLLNDSQLDGDVRVCQVEGGQITERILGRDDDARRYEYTITDSPMPVESIRAAIEVAGDDGRATVTWTTSVEPDELAEQFAPIYREGLVNLKRQLEGDASEPVRSG